MKEKLYIVMPAYNEAENIEKVINDWGPVAESIRGQGIECKIVVANDGSRDNTLDILHSLDGQTPYLTVLDKPNSGHGATVLFLYDYAIKNGCSHVFQTDSDGQTDPQQFYDLWEHRFDYDFQIGTRGKRKDGFSRVVVTKVLKLVVRLIFGVWVKDANTPFRLMNADKLRKVMAFVPADFFLANVAVSAIAVKKHYSVKWIPITFKPRQGGVNSLNIRRIIRIGARAVGDLRSISKRIK